MPAKNWELLPSWIRVGYYQGMKALLILIVDTDFMSKHKISELSEQNVPRSFVQWIKGELWKSLQYGKPLQTYARKFKIAQYCCKIMGMSPLIYRYTEKYLQRMDTTILLAYW